MESARSTHLAFRRKEGVTSFVASSYPVEAANQRHQGTEDFVVTYRFFHLIEWLIIEVLKFRRRGAHILQESCIDQRGKRKGRYQVWNAQSIDSSYAQR